MGISITETRSFMGHGSVLRQAIRAVVNRLKSDLTKVEELDQGFLLHFPTNLWNWGQRVRLDVVDDGHVTATSTSVNRFQMFDFGRNRQNVQRVLDLLSIELGQIPSEKS